MNVPISTGPTAAVQEKTQPSDTIRTHTTFENGENEKEFTQWAFWIFFFYSDE